ncbi:uncharacterized protein UV8b_04403 [Ustilaginoidea virens]|nr:uncharacterized protein UV8b_04403 [Ustilaginoidea virens]QUC20162.1 hypothetical protein UV8b_04403 [Ustilaginoidea virens]
MSVPTVPIALPADFLGLVERGVLALERAYGGGPQPLSSVEESQPPATTGDVAAGDGSSVSSVVVPLEVDDEPTPRPAAGGEPPRSEGVSPTWSETPAMPSSSELQQAVAFLKFMKSQAESQPVASASGAPSTPPSSKPLPPAAQSAPPKQAKLVVPSLSSPRPRADLPPIVLR